MSASATVFSLAWRHLHRIPQPLLAGAFNLAADVTWLRSGHRVATLEANLRRVVPEADARAIRSLSRRGMRSYLRYYREAFTVAHASAEAISARVRLTGNESAVRQALDSGGAVAAALGHLGNWDLAGAWATTHLAPVLTVAERLKPDEVYQDFLQFRESLGMTIATFGDPGVFATLQRAARTSVPGGTFIPLLADRDLGKHGVEVDLFGERARVAAGPAMLAITAKVPLVAVGISYEKLTGQRRKAAATRWGIVVHFSDPIEVGDVTGDARSKVGVVTQRWVDALSRQIRQHPEDWHMLQKVFIADLDAARYAAVTGEPVGEPAGADRTGDRR